MFRSAVRMKYIQVRDIMTPRTDMVTVADTATLREAARVSIESGYSRLPVHRSNRDQIVGILHAKDLLKFAAHREMGSAGAVRTPATAVFRPGDEVGLRADGRAAALERAHGDRGG